MREEYSAFYKICEVFTMEANYRNIKKLNVYIQKYNGNKEELKQIFRLTKKINTTMKNVEKTHPLYNAWNKYFNEIYGTDEIVR